MPRCGSGKLSRYGDLTVRSAAAMAPIGSLDRRLTSRRCGMAMMRGWIRG